MLRSLILALALSAPAAQAATVYTTQPTRGYAAPDVGSRVILRAVACAPLTAVGRAGGFVMIETRLGVAYVPAGALSRTNPDRRPALRLNAAPWVDQGPCR